jgi:hypothetical protein
LYAYTDALEFFDFYYLCSFIIAAYTSDIEDITKVLREELNIVGSAKSGHVGSKIIGSFKSVEDLLLQIT